MTPQPFEYIGACAVGMTAFFLFLQVAIYGDAGRGWIDRPFYIRAPMFIVAASFCYKDYAFTCLGEHFTRGGTTAAVSLAFWQFTQVFYAVTQSYKVRAEKMVKALMDHHPAWGEVETPVYVHGSNDKANKSS